jgi:hypothetical protein
MDKVKIGLRDILEMILIPIFGYGVFAMDRLSNNVANLNTNVGVLIEKSNNFDKQMTDFKALNNSLSDRVLKLEQRR